MRILSHLFFKLAITSCFLSFPLASVAQCSFSTLAIPGAISSSALDINDQGALVGSFLDSTTGASHGYLIFNGRFAKFQFPGSNSTEANGINNHGTIVGDYDNSSGQHGYRVSAGVFHSIAPSGPAGNQTRALGINNFGTIVGAAGANGFVLRGTKFSPVHFPGSASTVAFGINDQAAIVGSYSMTGHPSQGFIFKNDVYKTVDFPGADDTSLFRINNQGEIVGIYEMHGDVHGFSFAHGKFTTIDDPHAVTSTVIFGVNKFDRIAGSFIGIPATNKSFIANCSSVF